MVNIHTETFENFIGRLDEIKTLREHANSIESSQTPMTNDPITLMKSAICRGAILLMCSHIEAYFMDLGELTLEKIQTSEIEFSKLPTNLAYHILKDKIDPIINSYNSRKYDKLMNNLSYFYYKIGTIDNETMVSELDINSENIKQGISIPNFNKILEYFNRFGYDNFKHDYNSKLNRNSTEYKNKYDSVIETRHEIAHGKNYNVYTPDMLINMEDNVVKFCKSIDTLFADWCEQNLCSIR